MNVSARRRSADRRRVPLVVVGIALTALLASCSSSSAHTSAPAGGVAKDDKTVWLCFPGQKNDPCTPSLSTTVLSGTNQVQSTQDIHPVANPSIDCFYVYPTVSDQKTRQANLNIDPEERSIALYQAAYYSRYCRVFAPIYPQFTLSGIGQGSSSGSSAPTTAPAVPPQSPYASVLQSWQTYLKDYNDGRGVVFIGHSQGSGVLEELLSQQVDNNPAERKLLVSAIILGGNVTVTAGQDVGGTFQHIPACRSTNQTGCVVAFSTFDAPVPPGSMFGRTSAPGRQVLCTNPAALGGGSAVLNSVFPTAPFAPGTTIAAATQLLGLTPPKASTSWVSYPASYRGACSSADGANVLQIQAINGAPQPHAVPTATWGLHLLDAQIGLGNLVQMVGIQATQYAKQSGH